jgi:hypothetical protein
MNWRADRVKYDLGKRKYRHRGLDKLASELAQRYPNLIGKGVSLRSLRRYFKEDGPEPRYEVVRAIAEILGKDVRYYTGESERYETEAPKMTPLALVGVPHAADVSEREFWAAVEEEDPELAQLYERITPFQRADLGNVLGKWCRKKDGLRDSTRGQRAAVLLRGLRDGWTHVRPHGQLEESDGCVITDEVLRSAEFAGYARSLLNALRHAVPDPD